MQRINFPLLTLLSVCLFWGCDPGSGGSDFKAQKPVVINILADSLMPSAKADTAKKVQMAQADRFGFKIYFDGAGELHLYDEDDRHTGPATADEYLPVVETLLRQPSLHDQERAGLENTRAKIIRTGSAAEFATTRKIPNLTYRKNQEGTVNAEYVGAGEITVRINMAGTDPAEMSLDIWNGRIMKKVLYRISPDAGKSGQLAVSSQMDDFVISWDTNGDGKDDAEMAPLRIDSASVVE